LRQAEGWLPHLCQALLEESGVRWQGPQPRRRLRAVDGTVIKAPGPTGSPWRLHYSLRLPELSCDHCVITPTKGANTAEQLGRFAAAPGDILLADRCHPSGVALEFLHLGLAIHYFIDRPTCIPLVSSSA